jgi:hypothetical protein
MACEDRGAAAAEVTVEQTLEPCRRKRWVTFKCRDRRQHAAGRAKATHQRVVIAELPLDRVERGRLRKRLDGSNAASLYVNGEERARVVAAAVDYYCASAADAPVTNPFSADEVQPLAKDVKQRDPRLNRERVRTAIDREADRRLAGANHRWQLRTKRQRLEECGRDGPGTDGLQKIAPSVSGHAPGGYTRWLRHP